MYANAARYETAEQFFVRREAAVKLVQSCWRRYKAGLFCARLRAVQQQQKETQQQKDDDLEVLKQKERQNQLRRRVQPRTRADFDLLLQEVATWVR